MTASPTPAEGCRSFPAVSDVQKSQPSGNLCCPMRERGKTIPEASNMDKVLPDARALLRNLEAACDDLAANRSRETYLNMVHCDRATPYLEALDDARRDARTYLATPPASDAAVPAGFVLVPVEPTEAMLDAAGFVDIEIYPTNIPSGLTATNSKEARAIWVEMLAAAPKVAICGAAASDDGTVQKPQTGRNKIASDTCPFCTGASEYQGSPEDAFCERHLRLYRKANAA